MRLSETQGRKSDQGPKGLRRGGGKEVNFWSLGNRGWFSLPSTGLNWTSTVQVVRVWFTSYQRGRTLEVLCI